MPQRSVLFVLVLIGLISLTAGCKANEPDLPSSGDAYYQSGIEKYNSGQTAQGIEDIRTAREIYQRENRSDRIRLAEATLEQMEGNPLPLPPSQQLDDRDLSFLRATQDASGWSAWGNSSDQQKIETGRIACQKIAGSGGNLQDASQNLIFAHGGDPRNFSDLAGASIVVGQAVEYYCPEMRQALAEWMRRANQPPPFPDAPPLPSLP